MDILASYTGANRAQCIQLLTQPASISPEEAEWDDDAAVAAYDDGDPLDDGIDFAEADVAIHPDLAAAYLEYRIQRHAKNLALKWRRVMHALNEDDEWLDHIDYGPAFLPRITLGRVMDAVTVLIHETWPDQQPYENVDLQPFRARRHYDMMSQRVCLDRDMNGVAFGSEGSLFLPMVYASAAAFAVVLDEYEENPVFDQVYTKMDLERFTWIGEITTAAMMVTPETEENCLRNMRAYLRVAWSGWPESIDTLEHTLGEMLMLAPDSIAQFLLEFISDHPMSDAMHAELRKQMLAAPQTRHGRVVLERYDMAERERQAKRQRTSASSVGIDQDSLSHVMGFLSTHDRSTFARVSRGVQQVAQRAPSNTRMLNPTQPYAFAKVHRARVTSGAALQALPPSVVDVLLDVDELLPLPPRIHTLTMGDCFSRPLLQLPPTLHTLVLGDGFNHPLVGVEWPSSLTSLALGAIFDQPLVSLPRSLRTLSVRGVFDQPLTELPPMLEELDFTGSEFDQPLVGVVFPSSLRVMKLGDAFNQPLIGVVFPPHLEHLDLGLDFDQPLIDEHAQVAFPASLRILELRMYDHPLVVGHHGVVFPDGIKQLVFPRFNQSLVNAHAQVTFPASLTRLSFNNVHFRGAFVVDGRAVRLPDSLRTLDVGHNTILTEEGQTTLTLPPNLTSFNGSLVPLVAGNWAIDLAQLTELTVSAPFANEQTRVVFPSSLTRLHLRRPHVLDGQPIVLPERLEELTLDRDRSIDAIEFPPSLRTLRLLGDFNQPIARLPMSLTTLVFNSEWNQPLPPLPPSLTELDLGGFDRSIDGVVFPATLRTLRMPHFNQSIQHAAFPPSLVSLKLDWFTKPLDCTLPPGLETLDAGGATILATALPISLRDLTVHYNRNLWPPRPPPINLSRVHLPNLRRLGVDRSMVLPQPLPSSLKLILLSGAGYVAQDDLQNSAGEIVRVVEAHH